MNRSLRLGRLFGIPIDLHWTLVLVLAWVLYDGYHPSVGMQWGRVGWIGGVILLLFFFVLVHELGHALTAKAFGKPTEKILLFPLGGGAYIREQPEQLSGELMVYFGGPFANLLLALMVLPFLAIDPDRWLLLQQYIQPQRNLFTPSLWWEELLCLSFIVNLVLAAINLLPAYPLDGGRILQAALRRPLGNRGATLVVTVGGIIAAIAFVYLGYQFKDYLMSVGGLFVGMLSIIEINRGWQRRRLLKYAVTDIYRPLMKERLYIMESPERARDLLDQTEWPALPVYNQWNQLLGLVNEETLESAGNEGNLKGFYDPAFATGFQEDNLLQLTEKIIEADAYGALIYDRQQPIGLVLMDDIMVLLEQSFYGLKRPAV